VQHQRGWHRNFADPGYWGRGFLDLVGWNGKTLKPTSAKGGIWNLVLLSGSNSIDC